MGVAAAPSLGFRFGDGTGPIGGPIASPEPSVSPSASPTPSRTPRPTRDPVTRPPMPSQAPVVVPDATPEPPAPVIPSVAPQPIPTVGPVAPPPAQPTAPPPPPATDYSMPGGIYLDVPTPHSGYGEWSITLLDTIYMLPSGYYPGDLVDTSAAGLNGGYPVRSLIVGDLKAMADAARAAGAPLAVVSGFRSHAQQQSTFDYWVSVGGYEQALRTSARAGHSEHQLGTALDFTSEGGAAPWDHADWATTPAGAWMAANAWRYGFVMSYPAGRFAETGYDYEPWHYRYVGRDLAAAIVGSGSTTRGYLWGLQ